MRFSTVCLLFLTLLCAFGWRDRAGPAAVERVYGMPFNGTVVGGASFVAGKFTNGIQGASGKGATIPNAAVATYGVSDTTIEFWFKRASIPSALEIIFSIGLNHQYISLDTSGHLGLGSIGGVTGPGTGNVCDNAFHSVAITYKVSTTTTTFYVDGISVLSTSSAPTIGSEAAGITTGYGGVTTFDSAAIVDEVAISNIVQYTGTYTPASSAFGATRSGQVALYHLESDITDSNIAGSTLTNNGNLIVAGVSTGGRTITAPYTGGLTTPTATWYKSSTVNFTPGVGNQVANGGGFSGATTNVLTDTNAIDPATPQYYVCSLTDGTTTLTYYHRPAYAESTYLNFSVIGDSTSVRQPQDNQMAAIDACCATLMQIKGFRFFKVVNSAVSGSHVEDWWNGTPQTNLTTAKAAVGGSWTGYTVFVRLGVNNAQEGTSANTFSTNLVGLVAYIVSNGGRVLLSYPTWREPGNFGENSVSGPVTFDESTTPLLLAYQAKIDLLVDNVNVFAGDKTSYKVISELPQVYTYYAPGTAATTPGSIHPIDLGASLMGGAEAWAYINAFLPPTGIPVPAIGSQLIKGVR